MLTGTIGPLQERNTPGACKLQFIPVHDIETFPAEIRGTLPTEIVPKTGKAFTTIIPTRFTQQFREAWVMVNGDQFAQASLAFNLPKDRPELLDGLWKLKTGRYVVLHHDLNGTIRVMGTKDEPAMVRVQQVDHGGDPRRQGNRYMASVEVSRRTECPFYLATPPVPVEPGVCAPGSLSINTAPIGTVASGGNRNIPVVDVNTLEPVGTWNATDQRHEVQVGTTCPTPCEVIDTLINEGGAPNGNALVSGLHTGGSGEHVPYDTVDGKTAYQLGPWVLQWSNSMDKWYLDGPEFIEANTTGGAQPWDTTWPGGITVLPAGGGASAAAVLDCIPEERWDELRGVLCAAPQPVTVQLRDSAGANIGPPDVYAPGTSTTKTAPDGTVRTTDGLTTVQSVRSGSPADLPQSVIKYRDAANASQVTAASNTEFASATLRPATEVPRITIYAPDGTTPIAYVDISNPQYVLQAPAFAYRVLVYTASDVYVPDPAAEEAAVIAVGAGGGGGSGRAAMTSTVPRAGGQGGGGGALVMRVLPKSLLTGPLVVSIGAGGGGGARRSHPTTNNGANGAKGGNTSLDTLVVAEGGAAGSGGTSSDALTGNAPDGGRAQVCFPPRSPHALRGAPTSSVLYSGTQAIHGMDGLDGSVAAPSGGNGGGSTVTNAQITHGSGGGVYDLNTPVPGPSLSGVDGTDDVATRLLFYYLELSIAEGIGTAGAGGMRGLTGSGVDGGKGGRCAGGGGGGASGAAGVTAPAQTGAGGRGGDGLLIIVEKLVS